MSNILLNRNSDEGDLSIDDKLIVTAFTSDSKTHVEYLIQEDGYIRVVEVTNTLANLGNLSKRLISVTSVPSTLVVDSGTTDGTTVYKLVDAGQNFVTTVAVGMRVKNTTDNTYATVLAVDSNTILSLDEDIFVSGETYDIHSDSGSTVWVNKERIGEIGEKLKLAVLGLDAGGQSLRRLALNESARDVKTSMIEKGNDVSYIVDSYTAAPNTILLAAAVGDVSAKFIAADVFTIYGEGTSNDGLYSVVSAAFDGTNTVITVTELPTAATAHGGRLEFRVDEDDIVFTVGDQSISGVKTFTEPPVFTPTTGITAFATGGQGSAVALTKRFNDVTTVATAGDSVKLKSAVTGDVVIVKNSGATSLSVFPNTSDKIDDNIANLALSIPPLTTVTLRAIDAVTWESDVETVMSTGLVVHAGKQTIAAGGTTTAINITRSLISVDADAGGDIGTLADGTIGQIMTITCLSATGVFTITPANMSGGTSVTLNAAGESVMLQFVDTNWYIIGGNAYTVI